MAITIPELNSVSVLDDTDNIMLTHSNGNSEKISGANFKADIIKDKIENNNGNAVSINAVSTILATNTTITGPELGTGGNIKILFTSDIAGVDTSTGMSLTYNGDTIAVKVGKDGALEDFKAVEVSTGVYRYLQAYTTLELVFDGTYFIIVGNPVVLSSSTYTILADGTRLDQPINSITSGQQRPPTSGEVYNVIMNRLKFYPRNGGLTDCNTADDGLFCASNVSHTPGSTSGFVYVFTLSFDNNPSYRFQMCFAISNTAIYTRVCTGGTWGSWVTK